MHNFLSSPRRASGGYWDGRAVLARETPTPCAPTGSMVITRAYVSSCSCVSRYLLSTLLKDGSERAPLRRMSGRAEEMWVIYNEVRPAVPGPTIPAGLNKTLLH